MRVHVIGCSGSFAGPAGAASSYLIEHEDADGRLWRVLMDLGSGAFGPLQNVIDPADLDAVIISHLHPDHYLDVTGLEVFWAYHSRTDLGTLPIHAPAPLPDRISGVLGRNGHIPDGVSTAPFEYRALSDGRRFSVGPLEIQTRAVLHPVEAYGFRITADGSTFAYSGDTDDCAALDELAAGADLFLCEAGYIEGRDDHFTGVHLTGRRAGEVAARTGVRQLALTHIPAWTDPEIPLAEAREVHTGPITMVRPMDILNVSDRRAARNER
ncbi:MAG: MBL fold metallo-hydrolase [Dermabacteraceae bacterium]